MGRWQKVENAGSRGQGRWGWRSEWAFGRGAVVGPLLLVGSGL